MSTVNLPRPARAVASSAEEKVDFPVPLVEMLAPGGRGRLYTLSTEEASLAAERHGFRRQPTRAGYLWRNSFQGARAVHRLRLVGTSTYLLSVSDAERDDLVADGRFVDEGVMGYVAAEQRPGAERLLRFANSYEWRVAVESEADRLKALGYRVDGPMGWVHPEWIRAGAIYFGSWNPSSDMVIGATKTWYQRDGDWWGGVRDYYGRDPGVEPSKYNVWKDEDFSNLKPSIGYYDDSEPETLEKHITQASSAGLSFFQFYWYWNSEDRQPRPDVAIEAFKAARNSAAMDFAVTICAHPSGDLRIPRSDHTAAAEALVGRYLNEPNYLRANDGRLIVGLCDHTGLTGDGTAGAGDVRAFVAALRERARTDLNEEILVLSNWEMHVGTDPAVFGADGSYCGVRYDHQPSYVSYVQEMAGYFAAAPRTFMRCAASDFDERPRYPHLIQDPDKIRWYRDQTIELFRQGVGRIRTDIARSTRLSPIDNLVGFYAWNEWHEGGIIEPNVRDGCAYLDVIRSELRLTGGQGCVASGIAPS
ncbi:hypothetical protein HNP84_002619 [Thermocatellispora tengchongensis]|uniref:DUF5648 domain-containing protein n=1 Tax=Thermocatellispora tengchongensis TaxID=1073253 RepID=A0A840NZI3_9ACTN|nr:glycoside hydrolase family 99-like domain-containing protein [Thermocatellispora tengchongensis]MBB5132898.1 hypothetical protein [Thermocatellispora tengchongensis]